ncbi:MAG: hypothetical protein EOS29_02740 [Mesorhizobium sp.]|uniref:DUF5801 repeats-in-toxin domain-containing protein n=1 Tax=Mesorhizobium sp. TaxID=1871066 RepID=UPI000FE5FF5A|nr:DUF5801 repeats-in-toxin domain-containing protein [Mesorhizobium sp.]RWC66977.1 MAG: hypothetical protein EOS29_02740 [Mesorhizobium sp.]
MALDITAQDIIIDETAGFTDDDIDASLAPHDTNATLQYLLTLGTSLEVAFKADFVQATGDAGETITSVVLTQNLDGDPFSTTDGVLTDIRTVDGNYVWLFQDPTDPNVVIGVIGTDDPTAEPDEGGALAFSFGLDPTSSTNADLYLVEYVPLQHPLGGDSNPDDRIDLTDMVFASIAGTSEISFSGQNAAPGNHDFYLINSPDDAAKQLLVIGLNGGTANVSTQGFGIDNQSINPTETLQVDFVTGGDLNAGTASQIQYDNHLDDITEAGFTINQITPSNPDKRVDITIKAFDNTDDEQGSDFFDGTATSPVDIVSIELTGASGFAATITADGDYVTASGTIHVSGLDGTGNAVTITGLDNITTVDITTASQMDRLSVTGVDANEGCDITEFHFSATTTNAHTEEVGSLINFDDDGPTVTADGTVPPLITDDTDITDTASASFASVFSVDAGADGLDGVTYALDVQSPGVDSGLDDTLSGDNILLRVNLNGEVEGYLENDTATVAFLISVDENTGEVTLTQDRSIIHNDPADPVESGASAAVLAAADLVTLTATATDGDGDTDVATANIGTAFTFEDDGPTITVPFDGDASGGGSDGTHETLANTAGATASGAFGYDIGADARPDLYYDATHSDFVDSNGDPLDGVQIALTGTITGGGGGNLITSDVTLASETDLLATFNFTFTYDADPAAGEQTGTAIGTLVFDKDDSTYTITLTDPLEGFSFDLIHTSQLLFKLPTGNTGHPQIVVEQLQADDGATPNVDEDFYVQFTGNLVNKANPFGLTADGEGKSDPFDSTFAFGAHDMVSNANETWVSATQSTNGVAGDTIQKGELLTLRFFDNNVGIVTEVQQTPQTSAFAGSMAIKFDGIGNSEDLMLILNLADNGADNVFGTADDTSITRAMYVQNADIFKTGQVPSPYSSEFTLDNNDGLVIIEQNDYNAAGEEYLLQGVQIMQSGNGITGSAINLIRGTGAGGGSSVATNDLVSFDGADNDVLKIVDIAFSTTVTETPSANLDFAFQVADADGDQTLTQHILVDVA